MSIRVHPWLISESEETRAFRELVSKGRAIRWQEGRQHEARPVLRQFAWRLGPVPATSRARLAVLTHQELQALGEVLLDFRDPPDLDAWLGRG